MSRPANPFLPLFNLLGVLGAAFSYPALQWVTHCPGMNGYLVQAAAEMVGIAAGESLGQGSERPRLCAQIKAWSADKTQLSFLAAAEAPQGRKRKPECVILLLQKGLGNT